MKTEPTIIKICTIEQENFTFVYINTYTPTHRYNYLQISLHPCGEPYHANYSYGSKKWIGLKSKWPFARHLTSEKTCWWGWFIAIQALRPNFYYYEPLLRIIFSYKIALHFTYIDLSLVFFLILCIIYSFFCLFCFFCAFSYFHFSFNCSPLELFVIQRAFGVACVSFYDNNLFIISIYCSLELFLVRIC